MKLRQWQSQCVDAALARYQTQSHFMCLATPGAGKTIMAAELAARLIAMGKIDFVLCFSPSSEVNDSIRSTFSKRLNKRFDGLMGAIGSVYTYQFMPSLTEAFWQLLRTHKVFVIMDEVHHLKGSLLTNANAWGEEVLLNIQYNAAYTLALSGTPWRSDKAPIVLSRFTEPDNTIHCDFSYGLKQAIEDNVCRQPNIALIDNDKIRLDVDLESETFSSIAELLKGSGFSYKALINNQQVMHYMLSQGIKKLEQIRQENPLAGGLIVASSIKHAKQLYQILIADFKQTACIVTSKLKHPSHTIEAFRQNDTQWIVSVGMISEGTDIPRLQVCCHLSRIKTEMHYRQVLGRILRVTSAEVQKAWLFTLAEASLTEFAYRIDQDLPENSVIVEQTESQELNLALSNNSRSTELNHDNSTNLQISGLSLSTKPSIQPHLCDIEQENHYNLALLGGYKEQIVRMFDTHLLSS
ncbi:DEAD/DEAH box helicase family protein [Shewanella sp. SR43-4]|uniref:DEAD/DEAH box helicase n=1 Tax=Shewanella sp. SR43-4 TaxID=2760942 RepID=UPI0015FBD938|nr:DEAD/DEAH box helicase family protein [Shewanella sp. SR43-4]MBB1317344.1 DEAD/DEAH box helicase family protein [Shewanella sp. SR43-4]